MAAIINRRDSFPLHWLNYGVRSVQGEIAVSSLGKAADTPLEVLRLELTEHGKGRRVTVTVDAASLAGLGAWLVDNYGKQGGAADAH